MYPYRPSGKLYFTIPGQGNFVCSASLIKRGVVVTAAHCVTKYASKKFYTNFQFVPGLRSSSRPYGTWNVSTAWVMSAYFNGAAGQCAASAPGVVCKDDVAVLELTPQSGAYPGTKTGWYGYAWNKWGFTSNGLTHITQIGYPSSHNSGLYMMRNDSQGFIASSTLVNNTIIGSLMTGGSSGGAWLNNFGYQPSLSGTSFGSYSTPNMVVGVTSWGYTNTVIKEQGASPFTSTNIVSLVNAACAGSDPRCS
ncbi:MAG: trypsin-like serine protease [Nitrospira sp.]|nr:trypsin-like serine protease [Nitrospira sp.]